MLDIKFIKDNVEVIKEAVRKKHVKLDVDELMKVEGERLKLLGEVEGMRSKQNKAGEVMASAASHEDKVKALTGLKELKEKLQKAEGELVETMKRWQTLMLQVPNVPDMTVPEGESEADNQEVKTFGEKPKFSFAPKDHIELMTALEMVDFERGAKVHGFRGYFLTGTGVELSFAIWNYALKFFQAKGFTPVIPPTVVRKSNLYGTGHLPGDVEDYYLTQDGDALIGTAEIPLMAYHSEEVLDRGNFPIKYLGFSPCFRREAGSHGKDVKGLIRVHEFYKLEQVILCEADHQTSVKLHEEINRNTEEFIESLGLPYRTVINCGADLGLGQVKKYDIELWVPNENKYREIGSASYFHDFQTRRFNIRYRDADGKLRYAHSLNSTAIPTPRILVSLVENYQQADGGVKVPPVLAPYFGQAMITRAHGPHSSRITPAQ